MLPNVHHFLEFVLMFLSEQENSLSPQSTAAATLCQFYGKSNRVHILIKSNFAGKAFCTLKQLDRYLPQ